MTAKRFVVVGGCHIDQHLYFDTAPVAGRTNPARIVEAIGGVAANIAHHLAAARYAVDFVGVQPQHDPLMLASRLQAAGITAHLAPLAGEAPRYTALIGPDGELMIGAAALSIYDAASEDVVRSRLAASLAASLDAGLDARQPADAVVIDANFPAPVLDMLVSALPPEMPLCAAATSLAKVDRLAVMLARLSVIVLNRAEASRLAGIQVDDVAVLASTLATSMARRGSGNMLQDGLVLVSDGGNMAALATGDMVVTALPPCVRVISANGAGDAMAAGLFSAVLQAEPSPDLDDMLRVALAAGAEFAAKSITGHSIVGQN
jgi:pseudouridine kinase